MITVDRIPPGEPVVVCNGCDAPALYRVCVVKGRAFAEVVRTSDLCLVCAIDEATALREAVAPPRVSVPASGFPRAMELR